VSELTVYCDGSVTKSRYGDAVSAWCVFDENNYEIACNARFVRRGTIDATVNVAEHSAVQLALYNCRSLIRPGITIKINVRTDSDLVVKQINGKYRCLNKTLQPLLQDTLELIKEFKSMGIKISVEWIPRELNKRADFLSKSLYPKEK
jgi:ribonuclease HI